MNDQYDYEITCGCGAKLRSTKFTAADVDIAVSKFNSEHMMCRTDAPDLARRIYDLELITGMIPGKPVTVTPIKYCKHGKAETDYCKPCGRIHGG